MSVLRLYGSSLTSKWGFSDGDVVFDWLYDNGYENDVPENGIAEHDVLADLVRTHLVPVIEAAGHTIELVEIGTIHNPIRAERIDGQPIDWYDLDNDSIDELYVDVTREQIINAINRTRTRTGQH